ncbi:MAG: 16S rRNA (uracil(1498)-N(3))-methyltransferase [Corticimicrobacter sp.]|uniref:16S rRNA (uracil(1498)-N(3))-methyltransferase n=1 Tax=Corticimicrobacter sp. TaxID=2678536 RepID=UPI0032DAF67F
MSAPRFHCTTALSAHQTLDLPDEVAHHAIRVLRLPEGTTITLFDGHGGEYPARLIIDGKRGRAEIGAHDRREAELPGHLTLAQGLPAGDKMDWIIEKAVELGVQRISPIAAQRSVLKLQGDRLDKRLRHWRQIAVAACEQCGRNRIPEIDAPVTLTQWLTDSARQGATHESGASDQATLPSTEATLRLMCTPEAGHTLKQALELAPLPAGQANSAFASRQTRDIIFLIGPEGGWSPEEQTLAQRHGVQAIRLGSRVLRTETAGLALVAATAALQGWLND